MHSSNRLFLLFTSTNLVVIGCVALLNSFLSPWGIFLYLPGLFLLPHYQLLDPYRSLVSILISGFALDHLFNHLLGFHAFILGFIYLISKEYFHLGKQSSKEIVAFQLLANFGIALIWFFQCGFSQSIIGEWQLIRFLPDLIVSSLVLIPVSAWQTSLGRSILYHFEPSEGQTLSVSK
jgi:hypothetical protein